MKFVRIILSSVFAIVLVPIALLLIVYSQWGQDTVRNKVLTMLNSVPGTEAQLDSLSLRFPLDLDIRGLLLISGGDTIVSAAGADVDIALLPLLKGSVDVRRLCLHDADYVLGAPDSAMYMTIHAGYANLDPVNIRLIDMDIDVKAGTLRNVDVDMVIRQDTTPSTPSEPTRMAIHLRDVDLENVNYSMSMIPTIDRLDARIGRARLCGADINLTRQTIDIDSLVGTRLGATYIAPDSATVADNPVIVTPSDTITSPPWVINIGKIRFDDSQALYTTRGVVPMPGLDFAYIQADSMDLQIDSFYNCATDIRIPLRLHATERCGLTLDLAGTYAMDSAAMYFKAIRLSTPLTSLSADGMMGVGDLMTDTNLPLSLRVTGYAAPADLQTMFPDFKPYLAAIGNTPLQLNTDLRGTSGRLDISTLTLGVNGCVRLNAKGSVFAPFSLTPGADIDLSGQIFDVKNILHAVLQPGDPMRIPPMTLDGHIRYVNDNLDTNLKATTLHGDIALDASVHSLPTPGGHGPEKYHLDLQTHDFPVNAFMPTLGIGRATVSVKADGDGFDVTKQSTKLDGAIVVNSLWYQGYDYHNLRLDASIADGIADVNGQLRADGTLSLHAHGNLTGDNYHFTADVNGRNLDLQNMKLVESPTVVSMNINAKADISADMRKINADINVPSVVYSSEALTYNLGDISMHFLTNDTLTGFSLNNHDLRLNADARCSLDTLTARMSVSMAIIDSQISNKRIAIDSIQRSMPNMLINLHAGKNNFVSDILAENNMGFDSLVFVGGNGRKLGVGARMLGFHTGATRLDTVRFTVIQDSTRMLITTNVDNRPGTLDEFAHIALNGLFDKNMLSIRATQSNIAGQMGYDLGAMVSLSDSTVNGRFFPMTPIIGYRKWTLNLDNHLIYNFDNNKIDARIDIHDKYSSFMLSTNPQAPDSINDINLKAKDIKLSEILAVNPFAPQIAGDLSADMHVLWAGGSSLNGNGTVSLADFRYDKQLVGNFDLSVDVGSSAEGALSAHAGLDVNGNRVMTLSGALNDSIAESPVTMDLAVTKFPLSLANPFLSADFAQLGGTLSGQMGVTGRLTSPRLNGHIAFADASIKMAMTNTAYRITPVEVPMVDNIVTFTDFGVYGANDNPLLVNGTVDLKSLTSPRIDLALKANNLLAVNTNRASKNADIYGRLLLSLDASVKGNMQYMAVDADVNVLSGTNVSYILDMDPAGYTSSSMTDMVKFVNLADSTAVVAADSLTDRSMLLNLNATLNIQQGSTVVVDLAGNSRNKVQVLPQGSVTYTQTPMSDGRVVGRINIDGGFAHYVLPVIGSEKDFTFDQGSYIAFNGDMLNPVLNIHATDRIKANVTQSGQNSRLIYFDVLLGITGTLETMNVAFDLSTNDDITVANELQSMTPDQRANQAMNMLLYNMYTGPGTTASANLAANPLYSFLESQINNWAANNIKGVDLTFGIDKYNQTTDGSTSSTMNYSYRVSKTLFNDRFKIVVGGNYSTDDNADENISENLINDISFEYYLNSAQTMLLKLFRHTGYESILEGEVTQTGVGFVYKRKLNNLRQMLPKFMRPRPHRSKKSSI